MARRRAFGEVERRTNASGVSYRARYAMPDGTRYSRSFQTKMDAEAWLSTERALIDRDEWSPPAARKAAAERREREAATNTVRAFSKRYLLSAACDRTQCAATSPCSSRKSSPTSARCRCAT
jgi:hypothetical protein